METYLSIAKLYLEDDDPVQADIYVNRASLLQKSEDTTEQHAINYKVMYHFSFLLSSPCQIDIFLMSKKSKIN